MFLNVFLVIAEHGQPFRYQQVRIIVFPAMQAYIQVLLELRQQANAKLAMLVFGRVLERHFATFAMPVHGRMSSLPRPVFNVSFVLQELGPVCQVQRHLYNV